MKDQFYLILPDGKMPTGTAQQKGIRIVHGKPIFYKKSNIEGAEAIFKTLLLPHRPKKPSANPIKLTVWFVFDTKDRKKWGKPKATRPDTDNYLKLFKDLMTECGFWEDDAQVWDEHVWKTYDEKACVAVSYEEVFDNVKPIRT